MRRFNDLDVIRRGAARLQHDDDPVRREAGEWLRDVALNFEEIGPTEIRFAAAVGRAALTTAPAPEGAASCSTS